MFHGLEAISNVQKPAQAQYLMKLSQIPLKKNRNENNKLLVAKRQERQGPYCSY